MKSTRSLLIPLLCLAAVGLPFQAESSIVISESFSSPVGGVPSDWTTVIRNNADNNGAVMITEIPGGSDNGLRFRRAANNGEGNFSSNANGAVYYTASGSSQITDFAAEVTLSFSSALGNSSSAGIMFRTQSLGYQFSNTPFAGYYAAVTYEGLAIYSNPNGNATPGTLLTSISEFSVQGGTDYLFRVSAQGSMLTASLWNMEGTEELASVSYSDAIITDGYFGFRNGFGNYDISAYFRDLTVTVIPEPTSLVLLGVGGLALLQIRRRKRTV